VRAKTMSFDLQVTPSTLEVDYDKNLTELYRAITDQDWIRATAVVTKHPVQAATWVVRHYNDNDNDDDDDEDENQEVMWRFLPIHSACARQPPASFIAALISAYPDGARCIDDQGMYALHYAAGNQGSRDVIRQLLVNCPQAAQIPDPRGMLPVHYLACWGPSSVAILDMMLIAHRDVVKARDKEGNTPLDLALEGLYPSRDEVVSILKKWQGDGCDALVDASVSDKSRASSSRGRSSTTKRSNRQQHRMESRQQQQQLQQQREKEEEKKEERERKEDEASSVVVASNNGMMIEMERDMLRVKMELVEKKETIRAKEKEITEMNELLSAASKFEQEWKEKCAELDNTIKEQQKEIEAGKMAIEVQKEDFERRAKSWVPMEKELAELTSKLKESDEERNGLRTTLGDLMEQHQTSQKKSGNMNDRLGSLVLSLESMKEEQFHLEKAVRQRKASVDVAYVQRKEKLNELLAIEEAIKVDEEQLEASLQKQSRELEAISAVIKAARD
jgi:hypothetical protein